MVQDERQADQLRLIIRPRVLTLSCLAAACATLIASVAAVAAITLVNGPGPLLYITDHWSHLITAALAMSAVQAFAVHAMSFKKGAMLALGGNTSNGFYNASRPPPPSRPPWHPSRADPDLPSPSVLWAVVHRAYAQPRDRML